MYLLESDAHPKDAAAQQLMFRREVFDHSSAEVEGGSSGTAFPALKRDVAAGDTLR